MAVVLQFGVLAGSAQTNIYLFSGSETNITLNPGTYIITAYGAPGGDGESYGGNGAEMSGKFNFSASTTLTLLVGGGGFYYVGTGGGGGGFLATAATPLRGGGLSCAGVPDGTLSDATLTRQKLTGIFRRFRPRLVLAPSKGNDCGMLADLMRQQWRIRGSQSGVSAAAACRAHYAPKGSRAW